MDTSDEKTDGLLTPAADTTEAEMLVDALDQIKTILEEYMVSEWLK